MKCGHNKCKGKLHLMPADEPWHDEYYICEICDSTYLKYEIESRKPINSVIKVSKTIITCVGIILWLIFQPRNKRKAYIINAIENIQKYKTK